MMRKAGLSSQLIAGGGQHVLVDINPVRSGAPAVGYILSLAYDDGRHYQFARDPNEK
jgi:hypothetical protein